MKEYERFARARGFGHGAHLVYSGGEADPQHRIDSLQDAATVSRKEEESYEEAKAEAAYAAGLNSAPLIMSRGGARPLTVEKTKMTNEDERPGNVLFVMVLTVDGVRGDPKSIGNVKAEAHRQFAEAVRACRPGDTVEVHDSTDFVWWSHTAPTAPPSDT